MIKPSHIFFSGIDSATPLFRRFDVLISLGAFRRDVACLLAVLKKQPKRLVVLHTTDNYEFAVQLFAALHAGAHIILPGNLSENTRARLAEEQVLFVQELVPEREPADLELVDPGRVTVEFYTSGSTGQPKRILRTFANLEAELDMLEGVFPAPEKMTEVFATVNNYHAYGIIFALLLPLSRLILSDVTPFSGLEETISRINRYASPEALAWLITTPAFLRVWAKNADLCQLTHRPFRIQSAGAPLSQADAECIAAACDALIYEIFGSSETGVVAHRCPLEDSLWRPFREVRIEPAPEQGMRVYSPAVKAGEFAHLGDTAVFMDNGCFQLKPRVDRIVKLADKRVSLTEIEQCLNESGLSAQSHALIHMRQGINRLAVAVVPTESGMQLLLQGGYAAYKKKLRQVLSRQLQPSMMPRSWRIVGEMPCNSQGKVQVAEVEALFGLNLQLPLMLPVSKSADELVFKALYVKDSAYFAGHFPGYPLVPGVVILQTISTLAERYWGLRITGIVRLKFCAETLPGEYQLIRLTRKNTDIAVEMSSFETGTKSGQGRIRTEAVGNPAAYSL